MCRLLGVGVAKYKLCGRPGRGGYYFADQSGQGGGQGGRQEGGGGGINRFFCGRPLWMVPNL